MDGQTGFGYSDAFLVELNIGSGGALKPRCCCVLVSQEDGRPCIWRVYFSRSFLVGGLVVFVFLPAAWLLWLSVCAASWQLLWLSSLSTNHHRHLRLGGGALRPPPNPPLRLFYVGMACLSCGQSAFLISPALLSYSPQRTLCSETLYFKSQDDRPVSILVT